MKCFCHNDGDGKCAGALVYRKFIEDCEVITIDYGTPFPFDKVKKDEVVYIVDFSLKPDGMKQLMDITTNIVWIDHHKTSIQEFDDSDLDLSVLTDVVHDIKNSGCMLTWKYIHGDKKPPRAVELIEDMDIWKWEFGEETANFIAWLDSINTHPYQLIWEQLFKDDDYTKEVQAEGKAILRYIKQQNSRFIKNYGYEVTFEGHNCYAMAKPRCGSKAFDDVWGKYDLYISYVFDGLQYLVSLYCDDKKFDVADIARKHGGGGHKGASGFQCIQLPFNGPDFQRAKNI